MNSYAYQSVIKTNFSNAKLLVIEDNDDQWTLMKKALQHCLTEVNFTRITTPAQALSLVAEWEDQEWEAPKLILLNLYLPDSTDGWQLLSQFKTLPSPFSLIPIIILSSSATTSDIVQSYNLGVSSYIVKPPDYEGWLTFFQEIRLYWWETVTLPPLYYKF